MIRKGTTVQWKWGYGTGKGKVVETFVKTVTKTIKGSEITRNASRENKAFFIQQADGDHVLKSESEVERTK